MNCPWCGLRVAVGVRWRSAARAGSGWRRPLYVAVPNKTMALELWGVEAMDALARAADAARLERSRSRRAARRLAGEGGQPAAQMLAALGAVREGRPAGVPALALEVLMQVAEGTLAHVAGPGHAMTVIVFPRGEARCQWVSTAADDAWMRELHAALAERLAPPPIGRAAS